MAGRPTIYTEELAEKICTAIATHSIGLDRLRAKYPWFPEKDTIREWELKNRSFSSQYLEARRKQANNHADEIDSIDEEALAWLKEKGIEAKFSEIVAYMTMKANNRKWIASRLLPKVWGDRSIEQEQTNETLDKLNKLVSELERKKKSDY